MSFPVYAMDTCFYTPHGDYPLDVRCEMLAELGFDATYLTLWNEQAWRDVEQLPRLKQRFGLDVAGVYATVDPWALPDDPDRRRIRRLVETFDGCDTLELSTVRNRQGLAASDPAGDADAARYLEGLLEIATARNLRILLYPHINAWLERVEDAVRLCERIDHPNLGLVFCGFHWFAADGKGLFNRLDRARPWLRQVNLCGSRKSPNGVGGKATIEPLDTGEIDHFALLGHLRSIGYTGRIGIQGYSLGGDVFAHLRRSLAAIRDIESRLDLHPRWAADMIANAPT